MPVKTTVRHYDTPIRAIKIKDNDSIKCWQGCTKTGSLGHCYWKCMIIQPLQQAVWHVLRPNIQLTWDPTNALLGFYPRKMKIYVHRKICAGVLIAAFLHSQSLQLETTSCESFNFWMFTQSVEPPLCCYLLSSEKEQLLIQFGWILRGIIQHKNI